MRGGDHEGVKRWLRRAGKARKKIMLRERERGGKDKLKGGEKKKKRTVKREI